MPSYEVVKACYVPFGKGVRYRTPGQVVTLDADEAENLDGYVRPTATDATVQKLDTTVIVRNPASAPTVQKLDGSATIDEEVTQNVGDPQAGYE
jgi:hypothetical protein